MEITKGRSFSKEFHSESEGIIINEIAANVMGFEDPIGKEAYIGNRKLKIVGVAQNFHFKSLHEKVGPMFFHLDPSFLLQIAVRIRAGQMEETLHSLDQFYHEFNPGYAFNYKFLDQDFESAYAHELRIANVSQYFALVGIVISCLGLFGLAAFSAEKRTKEIGIRKILGCSVLEIVGMLSRDFLKYIAISLIIALPVSYLLSAEWLENFAYRIEVNWWYFIAIGILVLALTWITVASQTLRIAMINPADCLRAE